MKKSMLFLPVVAAATSLTAQAAPFAYDPFATSEGYSTTAGGDSLGRLPNQSGLSAANGFAAVWTDVPPFGGGSANNYLYRTAGSLSYSGLATTGDGGIEFTPADDLARDGRRALVSPPLAVDHSVLYMSFLLKTPANLDANGSATVYFRNVTDATNIGFGAGIADGHLVMQWRDSGSALQTTSLGTVWAANTTYLFVAKVSESGADWGGNDTLKVWVNPTDFTSEATLDSTTAIKLEKTDTSTMAGGTRTIGAVSVQSQNLSGAGALYFDELRFGAALADVLPASAPLTPPTAPSGLAVSSPTSSSLTLNWTDNSSNEANFKLERSPDGTSGWTEIATISANVTSYINTGLVASTTYYYRLRASNGGGDSAYTTVASGTTSAPPASAFPAYDPFATSEGYSVTAGGDSLGRLSNQSGLSTANGLGNAWTQVTGAISNYLYRAAGSLSYSGLSTNGNGGIQFTPGDDFLRDARRDLVTTTVNTANSPVIYLSFLLKTPADAVDADGSASVFFRANTANSTGFGAGIANGNLAMQYRDSGGNLVYESLGTAYTPGATYLFVVKAAENGTDWSGADSQTVWVNPTDFTDESTLSSSALATLTKVDTFGVANSNATGAVSFMSQNLSGAGVMYLDEIRAGETVASVLPAGSSATPTAPSGLAVSTVTSSTQLTLTWTDNSNNETGFKLERSPDGSSGWNLVTTTAADVTTYTNTGLTPGFTYFYRLSATNGSGDSAVTPNASGTPWTYAQAWLNSYSLPIGTSLAADGDNDDLENALEFVLGGNPTTNDTPSVRPTVTAAGSDLVLTFKRSDESEGQPIIVKVQTSPDLSAWTDFATIGDVSGSGYTVAENGAAADTVVVTIPKGVDAKKFARVVATY